MVTFFDRNTPLNALRATSPAGSSCIGFEVIVRRRPSLAPAARFNPTAFQRSASSGPFLGPRIEGMAEYRHSAHAVFDLKYHLVWCTKYRYKILRGREWRSVRAT